MFIIVHLSKIQGFTMFHLATGEDLEDRQAWYQRI